MNRLSLVICFVVLCLLCLVSKGCGDFASQDSIEGSQLQNDRISMCDGFEANGQPLILPPIEVDTAYCDAEVLYWRYDSTTSRLALTDARILLNCCGQHSMDIRKSADGYLVTERDWPEQDGRCSCMCVFDFALETGPIYENVIRLRVVREVADWPEGSGEVFEGDLDLSLEYGQVILDSTPIGEECPVG